MVRTLVEISKFFCVLVKIGPGTHFTNNNTCFSVYRMMDTAFKKAEFLHELFVIMSSIYVKVHKNVYQCVFK